MILYEEVLSQNRNEVEHMLKNGADTNDKIIAITFDTAMRLHYWYSYTPNNRNFTIDSFADSLSDFTSGASNSLLKFLAPERGQIEVI